jgi:hypothetical protein
MEEPAPAREAFGFRRTECGCAFCQAYCRHLPGTLDPSDLARLCPAGRDVFAWAEEHLRALTDQPYPELVPARSAAGHCHWYFDGRCVMHASAPYGCAFFDAHMADDEVERRVAATVRACREDAASGGLYYRVWLHLRERRLIGRRGDRDALAADMRRMRRRAEGSCRRAREK